MFIPLLLISTMGAFYNVVADCDKTMSKKGMKSKKLSKSKSLKKLKPKGLSLKSIESDPPSVVTSIPPSVIPSFSDVESQIPSDVPSYVNIPTVKPSDLLQHPILHRNLHARHPSDELTDRDIVALCDCTNRVYLGNCDCSVKGEI